ncbi:uncharacterized protein ColSpa_06571 [Colletotrichum spaethianum]|uniref:Vegetative incompatibility protein HET-E-1 n=1 Tax=Colletotrichum spaethianum TaxID=700344 RepID=A0AA37LI49_9PEZI|nr:uncharacterized protein ColSpa_06571 [Colletotrichum spaethianum]GKT46390.1 hypothetical protein ColSpa_06571 [Colletotrichum spaethianum]
MAEAFGLAVNIATVVELSAKIASICLQYSKDVKNAREEIARVKEETLSLKAVAESASELLEGPHGAALKASQKLTGAVEGAALRLKALDAELHPSSTRKAMRRFGVRALKWPFQSNDVEKLVRDIMRYTQMISMGLQIDNTYVNQIMFYAIVVMCLSIYDAEQYYSVLNRNSYWINSQPSPRPHSTPTLRSITRPVYQVQGWNS